jgi:hypothetical protein
MLRTQVAANRDREADAVNDLSADTPWFAAGSGQSVRVESRADVRWDVGVRLQPGRDAANRQAALGGQPREVGRGDHAFCRPVRADEQHCGVCHSGLRSNMLAMIQL